MPSEEPPQELTTLEPTQASVTHNVVEKVAEDNHNPTIQAEPRQEGLLVSGPQPRQYPYTVLSERRKIFSIILASFAAFISPVSSSAYFPALVPLSNDLGVSTSAINLSITVYMIFQGIAPAFIGTFSDRYGRRPAYFICFIVYIGANIGLALQDSYAALLVLRCVQSSGSSGTIALGSAVAADVVTRADRGKYIAYASMGVTLGPALGPIIGGLLTQFLGWRAIFWFLTIFACVMLALVLLLMPETCRCVVGNGSVPPPTWNKPVVSLILNRKPQDSPTDTETIIRPKRRPNPFTSVLIALDKEVGIILIYGAILYAGYISILSSLPSQLQEKYGFNALQVGLCFLPYGIGSLASRWTVGTLLDRNFRRQAAKYGIEIVKNRQQKLEEFPIERARLEITIPSVYISSLSLIAYSWIMQFHTNLAGPVIMLFVTGLTLSGAFNALSTLIVDINVESPATATAANNLFRCLFAAGAVAAIVPIINAIGMGWTGTIVGLIWIALSPMLWLVMARGMKWRHLKAKQEEVKAVERERKRLDLEARGRRTESEAGQAR